MRVLFINSVCGTGSTGKICVFLAKEMEKQGHEVKIAHGQRYAPSKDGKEYAIPIGSQFNTYTHLLKTRLLDRHCFGSKKATQQFIKWADAYNPDLLWLHNLHGYYLNIEVLFKWIKSRPQMKVKWTLHDCWSFTGHCVHFDAVGCDKWKTACNHCPLKNKYPQSLLFDNSASNYQKKKAVFSGVKDMMIITPSQWLANLVKESFLAQYPIEVIHNTINTDIFHPVENSFREKNGYENKKIVLGVASLWGEKKGFADMINLASILGDPYVVITIGNILPEYAALPTPDNFHSIKRTENQKQLAEIYTAADVFFNPTILDTYPTVNLEAEACGTPVVTYDAGGSKETISLPDSVAVPKKDLDAAILHIRKLCERE